MQLALSISLISLFVLSVASAGARNPSAPVLLWSHHSHQVSSPEPTRTVNYQAISHKNLADTILPHSGWIKSLCTEKEMDIAFAFVGGEVSSLDVSKNSPQNSALLITLMDSFSKSNYSMAFPYATASDERFESTFISVIEDNCVSPNLIVSDSCKVDDGRVQTLPDLNTINEYLVSRYESKDDNEVDVVIFCHPPSKRQDETFAKLLNIAESLNAKYGVVYASDPLRFPSHRSLQEINTNVSSNSTKCDAVCRSKATLLEGLFIGIVLLVILLSGICCMTRIDTPTRFEAPKES